MNQQLEIPQTLAIALIDGGANAHHHHQMGEEYWQSSEGKTAFAPCLVRGLNVLWYMGESKPVYIISE
jgi:hypothetical protein